jgi:hypothetical protein
MCGEAGLLGPSSAWFSERHLFDTGYLASPLNFAAGGAARNRRIRLETAILGASLHHPAVWMRSPRSSLTLNHLDVNVPCDVQHPSRRSYARGALRRMARGKT